MVIRNIINELGLYLAECLINEDDGSIEELSESTIKFHYIPKIQEIYESTSVKQEVKEKCFKSELTHLFTIYKVCEVDNNRKYYAAFALYEYICMTSFFGFYPSDWYLGRLKRIELGDKGNLYDLIIEFYDSGDYHYNESPRGIEVTEWKDAPQNIQALFVYPENYKNFLKGCFYPDGTIKKIKDIVRIYNTHRDQKPETIAKGVPTALYNFLYDEDIIIVPLGKERDYKLRSFQRAFEKIEGV